MKAPSATAHTRAMTPGSMLGGWKCTRADPREVGPKRFAEPVAVSSTEPLDFPPQPLRASSYGLSAPLQPTPAPRSAQSSIYGAHKAGARGRRNEKTAFCEF